MTKAAKKIESMKALTIKANELEAIALAASREDTRYYLCGVCVEVYKDGSYGLIATDGHRMASVHAKQKEELVTSFIIGNDTIKKALTLYKMAAKTVHRSLRDIVAIVNRMMDETPLSMRECQRLDTAEKLLHELEG